MSPTQPDAPEFHFAAEWQLAYSFGCNTTLEKTMNRKLLTALIAFAVAAGLAGCKSGSDTTEKAQPSPGVEQAVKDAVDVYVYGYPLVTLPTRRWDRF
jgi:hypothetical protein